MKDAGSNINRPDPDQLLSRVKAEEQKARRGRLKIFFGSSAGVGKTYAMLSAAHEQMEQDRSVLAGIVETHSRPETEKLLEGMPILQPLEIPYRSMTLKELDLDAALTRHPDIVLVDELAHTNAPGCRHPKRWNDVVELLDSGIDVYTTLNVQHIESLSDLIAGTTGVWMKETIPDSIFDMAEDVVLVDIDEDDLIKRLNEGKVYVAPGAKARAAENFFKKSNLSALREIALRRTAERVDAEREATDSSSSRLPISEKILVCVGTDSLSARLVRSTKRMANALKAPWMALYVDHSPVERVSESDAQHLESLERMVDRMGGRMVTIQGTDVADEIVSYAHKNSFTKIVVGKDTRFSIKSFFNGLLVNRIISRSDHADVYVITGDDDKRKSSSDQTPLIRLEPLTYFLSFLIVTAVTIPGHMMPELLTSTDQALLYLTGIILVAERLGLGPSLFYALLAACFFNIFIIAPNHSFSTEDKSYLITFAIMLLSGYIIATQASRLRAQAIRSRRREGEARALYVLSRMLSAARGRFPVSEVVADHVAQNYNVDVTVWMTNTEGLPSVILGNLPEETYYKDFGALQWCFDNVQNAGRGTSTLPSAAGFYLPLLSGGSTLGVIGVFPKDSQRHFTGEEVSSLETIASLLGSALDRVRAGEIAQQVMIEKENQRIRHSLGSKRAMTSQTDTMKPLGTFHFGPSCPYEPPRNFVSADSLVFQKSMKLGKDLMNLFDLESASISNAQMNRRPTSILDRAEQVRDRLLHKRGMQNIEIRIGADLPDVLVDLSLIEQVFEDLILFALKRTPDKEDVIVTAKRSRNQIIVTVSDQGPALPNEVLNNLFDSYAPQIGEVTPDSTITPSLSVTAGIVRLHGGMIEAESLAKGGVAISFSLPIA